MERKKENMYLIAVIILDILLFTSLFHSASVEKNCQALCQKDIDALKQTHNIKDYYETGGIKYETYNETNRNWSNFSGLYNKVS